MRTTDARVVSTLQPCGVAARVMVACLVLLCVGATACSDATTDNAIEVIYAQDDGPYPLDSVRDVVAIAESVVVVTVNSERVEPLTVAEEATIDDRPVVKFNYYDVTVNDVIWSASDQPLFGVGESFELEGNGAWLKGERSDRFHPHMASGGQYVVAILNFDGAVVPFNPEAISPVDAAGNLTDWVYDSEATVPSALASLPDEPVDTIDALRGALAVASRS